MNTDNSDNSTNDASIIYTKGVGCNTQDTCTVCTNDTSSAGCMNPASDISCTDCMDRASGISCTSCTININCNDAIICATCIGSPDYADRSTWVGQIGRAK